jgi:hypothetical protein
MFELYLLTFNCARNLVDPNTLAPSLFDALSPSAPLPDLVAISLQEISPIAYSFLGGSYLTPYFAQVTKTVQLAASLRSHDSEQLEHVATRSLGMTALMIFAKPQFAGRIQWIQSAGAGVGFWNMGNKGAVAMRLGVSCPNYDDPLKITLTAAHLAPMESNIEARNRDWETIVRNLVFLNDDQSGYSASEATPLLSSSSEVPADGDGLFAPDDQLIFFAGDLNYRTHDEPPRRDAHMSYPQPSLSDTAPEHFGHLLKRDQLMREKDANRTLHHLEELPITFPPTYKYSQSDTNQGVPKEERWEWATHRYPSWCDRILFLPSPGTLEPQVYTALPVQPTSDHRPVALSLRVDDTRIKTNNDNRRPSAPFPINNHWRARRDAARRMEVLVGVLSYLALTKKGNAILLALTGTALATWWVAASLLE